jgi:hypothetical protein
MKKKLLALAAVPGVFLVIVVLIALFNRSDDALSADPAGGSSGADAKVAPGNELADEGGSTGAGRDAVGTPAVATQPMTRAVISTGQVSLRPDSVNRARAEVMRLVTSWGGAVADEQTGSDHRGRIVDSTITVRVPSTRFSEAMSAFARLGTVDQQSRESEDVTTKVIDNDARVRAAERSIRQIENLLGRAQRLSDVIAIESDLARRQADLDSLKSQQAYLADQTSLSTINVYLSRTASARPAEHEARGFVAGLDDGWTAMKAATVVLLTVIGAVLPFAVVLLVLGLPLWLLVRRRVGHLSAASAPARSA